MFASSKAHDIQHIHVQVFVFVGFPFHMKGIKKRIVNSAMTISDLSQVLINDLFQEKNKTNTIWRKKKRF